MEQSEKSKNPLADRKPSPEALVEPSSGPEAALDDLIEAVMAGDSRKTMLLLEAGADPNAPYDKKTSRLGFRASGRIETGERVIDLAAADSNGAVLRLLIPRSDLLAATGSGGKTALMRAAERGSVEEMELFFPDSDLNAKDLYDNTALLIAIRNRKEGAAIRLASDPRCDVALAGGCPLHQYMAWMESGPDESGEVPEEPKEESPIRMAMRLGCPRVARAIAPRLNDEQLASAFGRAKEEGDWDSLGALCDLMPKGMPKSLLAEAARELPLRPQQAESLSRLVALGEAEALADEMGQASQETNREPRPVSGGGKPQRL